MRHSKLHLPDRRMIELITYLKETGKVEHGKEFCDAIGLFKQNLFNIQQGNQRFRVDHIIAAGIIYNVNSNWIFGLEPNMFRTTKKIALPKTLPKNAVLEAKQRKLKIKTRTA